MRQETARKACGVGREPMPSKAVRHLPEIARGALFPAVHQALEQHQGNVLGAAPLDDHNFAVGCDFAAERREMCTGTGV